MAERGRTSHTERRSTRTAFEDFHAEHGLVVVNRALEIADLKVNRADMSLLRQTYRRRNTLKLRNVPHFSTHRFTSCRLNACQTRAASMVSVTSTSSPTRNPPVSSAVFQLSPKSLRFSRIDASKATRSFPYGSRAVPR